MQRIPLVAAALALVLGGCSADAPTEPGMLPAYAVAAAASPISVAGDWHWTREERLTFPPFAALAIFGVQPEGERTVATCHAEGTISFNQDGTSFSGTEVTVAGICETQGGQAFAIDPAASVAGEVVGRVSLHMIFQGMVPCLLHAVARDITDGVANALAGGGRCIIPGHPQSPVPGFDPPPLGTEVITSWNAVRQ
jgi:hypothetical protein